MNVVVWVTESSWAACVDAAIEWARPEVDITLLCVSADDVSAVAHAAFMGLLGRGHAERDPAAQLQALSATAARELLDAAAQRLGRTAKTVQRHGRVEHEVLQATAGADLLICARDGDLRRLGPHSLDPPTRFVVDHAPCAVLLVWPRAAPDVSTLPPGPPPPPGPPVRP